MIDPYQILGLDKTATQEEITRAYRALAIKYHPDKNLENTAEASEKFKEVSAAFELIGDEGKRKQYDFYRNQPFPSFSFRSRNSVDDIFGNIFSQFFGNQKQSGPGSRLRLKISLKEAYFGCTKKTHVEKHSFCDPCKGTGATSWIPCEKCEGRGFVLANNGPLKIQAACSHCQGKGSIPSEKCKECEGKGYLVDSVKEIEIKTPPGIFDGAQIRLAGEAPDGNDLFIVVHVERDEQLIREDKFLLGHVDVSYPKLILGGDVEFDLFGSKILVKIPPRTTPGSRMRIKGQGMPLIQNPKVKGDLLLEVRLNIPKSLSKNHEKLLNDLLKIDLDSEK